MKNSKKLVLLALVLILLASTLVAGAYTMKYARVYQDQSRTVGLGNAGITYASAYKDGTVQVLRRDDSGYHAPYNHVHVEKLLEVRFYDLNWTRDRYASGAVWVWYDLTGKEMKLWDAGLLSIKYFDTWKNQWKACPTFELKGGSRVACRVYAYGVYGLVARQLP